MKLDELVHGLIDRRVLPVTGDFVSLPLIAAVWATAESEMVKWLSAISVVVLLATRVLSLALQVRGATRSLRSHNEVQDGKLEDHEARLKKLEAKSA